MRTRFGPQGKQTTQELLDSIRNRPNFPTLQEIEMKEPYHGFNAVMTLNGWYWETYGSVIRVIVETRNLARIERAKSRPVYKSIPSLRRWLSEMGYEKEGA
jgi:hypothetical protein